MQWLLPQTLTTTPQQAPKLNFEDIQDIIRNQSRATIMINTLPITMQSCLIPLTIAAVDEEQIVDKLLQQSPRIRMQTQIVVYGQNCSDAKLQEKYQQLIRLGFAADQVHLYVGGMFEWLLLQDIYGATEFPTTTAELDLLRYKAAPTKRFL